MSEFKLIRIYAEKKYVLPLRIIMLVVAYPFIQEAYQFIESGVIKSGQFTFVLGEHWGFYAHLSQEVIIALVLLWLGSFGIQDKKNKK